MSHSQRWTHHAQGRSQAKRRKTRYSGVANLESGPKFSFDYQSEMSGIANLPVLASLVASTCNPYHILPTLMIMSAKRHYMR